MDGVTAIFSSLTELRRFAETGNKDDLLGQVQRAETIALAEICEGYCESKSDDYYAVMMQIFPDVYRSNA
ncbi:hypothetical protein [uncultured Tateyamaria sp.]|uniref:hypothetical protein n=1 Tax=uncultured Tateyamaria sp. TaxID=455651 RepID=UPI002621CA0F|nr:hypothetical protein [uncultured Tateyamaria sp.]